VAKEKRTAAKEDHSIGFGKIQAQIEERALEIFRKRQSSRSSGDELSDWLQAEKEVRASHLLP
jgi:Protein of unknown function (DUF2934)